MLQQRNTRFTHLFTSKVAAGVVIAEEGTPLKFAKENGETVVLACDGTAGDAFAGLSVERNTPPGKIPYVASYVIPTGLQIVLPRAPAAGHLGVKVAGVAKTIVTGAPASAAEVQIVGNTLTFFAGENTKAADVTFLYTPSVEEARSIVGDAPFAGLSSAVVGVVGRFTHGTGSTSMFDATADWASALYVKMKAGGLLTPCAFGDAQRIPNVVVKNTPSAADPFLTLDMNIA